VPLPTPNLDDRRFQDLVDQAKRMIPQFCPEWTDHNVSDPGVTLIELFAWMTDLLLYRVNQVPDKMFVTFLDMLGIQLAPPRAARVPVTFYLSAPQPVDVLIPAETEVSTVRTETSDAIIFTTESDLDIRPPTLIGAFTREATDGAWTAHDLRKLGLPGAKVALFPESPSPGDAFYMAFERDHGNHVLALVLGCETASGAGVDPTNPPIEWQVWQGGLARWASCEVEYEGTGGFNQDGEVILHLPPMAAETMNGLQAFWLRCRLTDEQAGPVSYRVSPRIESIVAESRGGTAPARHAITVLDEHLGRSEGTPGQTFQLLNQPLLARDASRDHLVVEPPDGAPETWAEVSDFADSQPEDRHYTLDSLSGVLTLGPALIQPDGTVHRFGAVPPRGSTLSFSRYQFGGGVVGNVPRDAISVLKTSIPYVARVINRAPSVGGRDAQTLDDARLRVPSALRTRTLAVTADDFEYLARQVNGVARTRCVGAGAQPGEPGEPRPGQVVVAVMPEIEPTAGRIPPEQLALSAELREAVSGFLRERCLIGTQLEVRAPQYIWISVRAQLRMADGSHPAQRVSVQQRAEAELYRFLNPHVGGPRGDGWPFGRELNVSELVSLLQRIPGVEFVDDLQVFVTEPGGVESPQPIPPRLVLPRAGVVCSDVHRIAVS
jgi:predicted phage baseplate assembly protein